MRVAKYNANPDNPMARETIRFRFSDDELKTLTDVYGNGRAEKLRFKLQVIGDTAKLIPTREGGMAVTKSPSGKNFPWEVGFNHKSSPDISKLGAIPTSEAFMALGRAFLRIKLPLFQKVAEKASPAPVQAKAAYTVSRADFSSDLRSPADMELLTQAVRTLNEVVRRTGVPLDLVDGQVRAYIV